MRRTRNSAPEPDDNSWWHAWLRRLRNLNYVSEEQVEEARRVRRSRAKQDPSEMLISLGMVGERELLQAKAQEMGYAFADFDRVNLDPTALALVPPHLARAARAIPLKRNGPNMWVAFADPSNLLALDAIREASGLRIIPVLAVPSAIDTAIDREYPL